MRTQLQSKQLVGMLLIIYVKAEHLNHISDVATSSVGTGIMGMMVIHMRGTRVRNDRCVTHGPSTLSLARHAGRVALQGNKGGVSVRFRMYDSYLVFINSHFASGTKEIERRNLDFREVSQRLLFEVPSKSTGDTAKYRTIYDSEYAELFCWRGGWGIGYGVY